MITLLSGDGELVDIREYSINTIDNNRVIIWLKNRFTNISRILKTDGFVYDVYDILLDIDRNGPMDSITTKLYCKKIPQVLPRDTYRRPFMPYNITKPIQDPYGDNLERLQTRIREIEW